MAGKTVLKAGDVTIEWDAPSIVQIVSGSLEETMAALGIFLEGIVKKSIAQGQPPSRAGQPPHQLRGELMGTITHTVDKKETKIVARIGSTSQKAARLELGFVGRDRRGHNVNQAPRPFLRPAIYKHKAEIRALVGATLALKVKSGRRVRTTGRVRQTRAKI